MGQPAAVAGDRLTGTCATHLVPGPLGAPLAAPPMPFATPITVGVVPTVQIGGKPVVVMGSGGPHLPPHVGLHPADPMVAAPAQKATVTKGSLTVLAGGRAMARAGDPGTCCLGAGVLVAVSTVLVGG